MIMVSRKRILPLTLLALFSICTQSFAQDSLHDQQAKILIVQGESTLLKKGRENWMPVREKEIVENGDKIFTKAGALVQIAFDDSNLNLLRIEENTQAEFRSIEPTDIFLSDGTLFNQLEGLTQDDAYRIATPTAVAGVRGTRFLRRYNSSLGEDETQVENGKVEVAPVTPQGEILWEQGLTLEAGQFLRWNAAMLKEGQEFKNLPVQSLIAGQKMDLTEQFSKFVTGRFESRQSDTPPPRPQIPYIMRSGKEEPPDRKSEDSSRAS